MSAVSHPCEREAVLRGAGGQMGFPSLRGTATGLTRMLSYSGHSLGYFGGDGKRWCNWSMPITRYYEHNPIQKHCLVCPHPTGGTPKSPSATVAVKFLKKEVPCSTVRTSLHPGSFIRCSCIPSGKFIIKTLRSWEDGSAGNG